MAASVSNSAERVLYFFQYLAPWKLDVFNEMARHMDLTVVLFDADREGFTYDRESLLARLHNVRVIFWNRGWNIRGHQLRFGIDRILRKYRPQRVFVHEYSQVTASLILRKKRWNYRLILTSSDNLEMAKGKRGLIGAVRSWALERVDGAIFYTADVARYFQERHSGLTVRVCPNIQNPESLLELRKDFPAVLSDFCTRMLPGGERVLLYVGRLVHVKGLDLLLRAFAHVPHAGWKLVLTGEGEERSALESIAAEESLSQDVIFTGFRSGKELYALYDLAECLVLPSRFEPFGAVVNEALVLGCPVLASCHIGASDFLDDSNSILFDPLDEKAFRAALEQALCRFGGRTKPAKSLMIRSFHDYVKAYIEHDE